MTDDLGQALVHCREKVEGLYKDIERLKADNARLRADYLSRIPREHYAQMQAQIDELSRKCVRQTEEVERLTNALHAIKREAMRHGAEQFSGGKGFAEMLSIASIAAHALEADHD